MGGRSKRLRYAANQTATASLAELADLAGAPGVGRTAVEKGRAWRQRRRATTRTQRASRRRNRK